MSKQGRLTVALAVHLVVTSLTWRDLSRRAPSELRGAKWFWRLASSANTLGSLAYWTLGRKRTDPSAEVAVSGE